MSHSFEVVPGSGVHDRGILNTVLLRKIIQGVDNRVYSRSCENSRQVCRVKRQGNEAKEPPRSNEHLAGRVLRTCTPSL